MTLGLNHITFAVTDVARSVAFYVGILGCTKVAVWDNGAYVRAADTWICLSKDAEAAHVPHRDYSHVAFSLDTPGLESLRARLWNAGFHEWKQNTSEGDSIYFTDPDGHKLEAHSGDLQSRLAALRSAPYSGLTIHEADA